MLFAACGSADRTEQLGGGLAGAGGSPFFTDITHEAGLGGFRHETGAAGDLWMPETFSAGLGIIDYDGDGWQDILVVAGGFWPGTDNRKIPVVELYRNMGDGTFERRTEEAGLADISGYGFGLAVADYDNDGDEDFFLSTLFENMLFRNDGGRFEEVGRTAGLAGEPNWSTSAIFFDADRDGHVDLYVGNYVHWTPENDLFCTIDGETKSYCSPRDYDGIPGRFYRNNGDGTFEDRTDEAGLGTSPGKTLGVAELDFNLDGWPDLVVANDTHRDLLYENNRDGTFTERGVASGIAFDANGKARAGMGIDVGDVDNSGQPTVVVGNFSNEMVGLYRHIGNGVFVDRAALSRVGQPSLLTLTFGLFLFDVDLDGDLDLFLANGHIFQEMDSLQDAVRYRQPAQLFLNHGDGTFAVGGVEHGAVFDRTLVARGAAYVDFDRDGDLDVLLIENGGPVHLWRNDTDPGTRSGNQYLTVNLEGVASNRSALGATVTATINGIRQQRRVRSGSSYLSQSQKAITFGMGSGTKIDSLTVHWPSGRIDTYADIAASQEILLREGIQRVPAIGHESHPPVAAAPVALAIEPARKAFDKRHY